MHSAQRGGAGVIVYNRKEGRALGEVRWRASTTRHDHLSSPFDPLLFFFSSTSFGPASGDEVHGV